MDFEAITEEMCDKYCKWPEWCKEHFKDPDDADDYLLNEVCPECPMTKLLRSQAI